MGVWPVPWGKGVRGRSEHKGWGFGVGERVSIKGRMGVGEVKAYQGGH